MGESPDTIHSFTSSWKRALKKRQDLIEKGRKDVVIIAIWSKGLRNVYDAYEVADIRIRQWLLKYAKPFSNRTLANFNGQGERENIAIGVAGLTGSVTVPEAFIRNVLGETPSPGLEAASGSPPDSPLG